MCLEGAFQDRFAFNKTYMTRMFVVAVTVKVSEY